MPSHAEAVPPPNDAPAAFQPDKIVTVLSVSPSPADQSSLGHLFRHTKWTLLEAATRAEAERTLAGQPVPVVICDSTLPDGDWKGVLQLAGAVRHPPVLIVTSRVADDRLWSEVMEAGAYDVLEKPFNQSELFRVVSLAWLEWKRQFRSGEKHKTAVDI